MCDFGLTLGISSILVGIAGTAVSMSANQAAAKTAENQADYNAEVREMQAEDRIRQGDDEVRAQRLRVMAKIKSMRAAFANNGIIVSEGSALDVQVGEKFWGEMDANTILMAAQRDSRNIQNAAQIESFAANATAARYRNRGIAMGIQGVGSALTSTASVAGDYQHKQKVLAAMKSKKPEAWKGVPYESRFKGVT